MKTIIFSILLLIPSLGFASETFIDEYQQVDKKHFINGLIFGNKTVLAGINPELVTTATGGNFYQFTAPNLTLADAYFTLQKVTAISSPQVVVLDGELFFDEVSLNQDVIESIMFKSKRPDASLFEPAFESVYKLDRARFNNLSINQIKQQKDSAISLGGFIDDLSETGIATGSNSVKINTLDRFALKYLALIKELCAQKNMVVLVTLLPHQPKNKESIKPLQQSLKNVLNQYQVTALDFTSGWHGNRYDNSCFFGSDGYQRFTPKGIRINSYNLVDFLINRLKYQFPNRTNDENWRAEFSKLDGFHFYNEAERFHPTNRWMYSKKDGSFVDFLTYLKRPQGNFIVGKISGLYQYEKDQIEGKDMAAKVLFFGENDEEIPLDVALYFVPSYSTSESFIYFSKTMKPDVRVKEILKVKI